MFITRCILILLVFESVTVGGWRILLSFVPVGFLIYILLNQDRLGIPLTHPRVVVERVLFMVFLLMGLYIRPQF